MGKNTRVKIKKVGGKPVGRQGAAKPGSTNHGRLQKGAHSMNPDRPSKVIYKI